MAAPRGGVSPFADRGGRGLPGRVSPQSRCSLKQCLPISITSFKPFSPGVIRCGIRLSSNRARHDRVPSSARGRLVGFHAVLQRIPVFRPARSLLSVDKAHEVPRGSRLQWQQPAVGVTFTAVPYATIRSPSKLTVAITRYR